jgi:hypothetical protein
MPRRIGMPLVALLATFLCAYPARAQAPVPLGGADAFAVLAGTAVTNSGATVVNGDLGVSPGSTVSGFPPGTVNGTTHVGDATAAQAQLDLAAAYANAGGQPASATIPAELGGTTLPPGVYESDSGSFAVTGTLTLDGQGNGNGIFIFRAATSLATAPGNSQINLIKGAQSCNVFWQVGSSATLGGGTVFRGNLMAAGDLAGGSGATVDGRLLTMNGAVSLDDDLLTTAQCDRKKPTVKITKIPRGCTAHSFKARLTTTDDLTVTTDVFIDGGRVKRSSKKSFTALIEAKSLGSGTHKITAVSRDAAGNERTKTARFKRCARSGAPSFTG